MEATNNVALIGCGVIARMHLHALKKTNSLKVVAVCDTDTAKAVAIAKEWNIPHYYTDLSKMLSNENISILSILTPPSSHATLAIEAIKQGVNVLVEKPLTMTSKDANSINTALKGSSAKMTVVYHYLFTKAMLEALSLIKANEVGEVISADMKMVQNPGMDPMASDANHWSHKLFGGRLGEMLAHPVYILQSVLGNQLNIEKIFLGKRGKISWIPFDELHVLFEGEKGFGSLYVSLNAPRCMYELDVYGTSKILRIDLIRQMLLKEGPTGGSNLSLAKGALSDARTLSLQTARNAFLYSSSNKHGASAVSGIYDMFANSIRNNWEPSVTPEMAFNTVKIVEEICTVIEKAKKGEIEV
jgi:2-alkyl-3-oxoalkanoate reductase